MKNLQVDFPRTQEVQRNPLFKKMSRWAIKALDN